MDDRKLLEIIQSLDLKEKAALCSGLDAWQTKGNAPKEIPSLRMSDGPHGVRVEDPKNVRKNGGYSKPATCFPPEVTLACAWSPELCGQVGAAIADECLQYGVGMVLGPGVNIKRSPLGGRNFEYYSEDPLLAGELAVGFINGVQAKGVGTSLKHYAVNNQEKLRMSINAAVDDRALFEIYLKAFEIAVNKAQPATVMASYNRVDGVYATENRRLLTDILRLQFGFTGAVVTDWGAVNDRAAGIAAGCDLEMPGCDGINDHAVVQAVQQGALSEDALDAACWNLLRLKFKYTRQGKPTPPADFEANHQLAADALCKSAVLLKNKDDILPLEKNAPIALIGELAAKPRYQGSGSSVINPARLVSILQGLEDAGADYVYEPGHEGDETRPLLRARAVSAAAAAQVAVLVLGLPDAYECEGYDRQHLSLPQTQLQLLKEVAKANPNLVVVLCCGSPIEMPWPDKAKAVLCPHLGGQALGDGVARLLYGDANPGGKLAESWPMRLEDVPCHGSFPMGPAEVHYRESIYVGYRYYATAGTPVLFPFGHGLGYTSYEYTALGLSTEELSAGQALTASVTLRNTGGRAGEEIVQIYLKRKGSARFQPALVLAGFARVALDAGQQKTVEIEIPHGRLGFYDPPSHGTVVEAGEYELLAGPSSETLPLSASFTAKGVSLQPDGIWSAEGPYGNPSRDVFTDAEFAKLYQKPFESDEPVKKGEYTPMTTLGQARKSAMGRFLCWAGFQFTRMGIHFSADREANMKAARAGVDDLPFKNLVSNTWGIITPKAAKAILDMCNGKGGFGRLISGLLGKREHRS